MKRHDQMPALVYWGLWGISTRRVAAVYMWGCIAVGTVSTIAADRSPQVPHGIVFFLAALWYWHSIRWVDKNSSWISES